jgi:hypothetical protein
VIVRIGEQQVAAPQDAAQIIGRQEVGKSIPIVVMRGDEEQTVEVVLADRHEFLFDDDQDARDERGADFQGRAGFGEFRGGDVPEHAMMLEQHRRFAEQHERMERMLFELHAEVKQLRQDLKLQPQGQQQQQAQPQNRVE